MKLLRAVQHVCWSYSTGDFLAAVERTGAAHRVIVLIAAGVIAGAVAYLMSLQPGGHAGEIGEIIWFRSAKVPLFRTLARAVVSMSIVAMGASLGREAAPKQTGAAIASALCSWARVSPTERRLLVACGAGAGMAAVYDVPLGGAMFALEVLLGSLDLPLVVPALTTSLIATWVSWLFLPDQPTYSVPTYQLTATLIYWSAVAGPLIGVATAAYVRLISWADACKPKGWLVLFAPIVTFAMLGATAIRYPQVLGNGKDIVQETFVAHVDLPLIAVLLLLKPIATSACLGSGAPGGLFTPTITTGALAGGLLGRLWQYRWPDVQPESCAVIGAGAFLAAAAQGPISSIVLLVELTRNVDALMVPLMLAIAGSISTARWLEPRSIYSGRIHTGRSAAAFPKHGETGLRRLVSKDYAAVSTASGYGEVLSNLIDTNRRSRRLYVIDEEGKLAGVIAPSLAWAPYPAQRAIATAGDFAEPVQRLASDVSEAVALDRVRTADAGELPVIDAESGRMIGIVARRGLEDVTPRGR